MCGNLTGRLACKIQLELVCLFVQQNYGSEKKIPHIQSMAHQS